MHLLNEESPDKSRLSVPGAGLEPAQPLWSQDFKSCVSTIPPSGQKYCLAVVQSCSRAVQYTVMEVQIYNKNQLNQIITDLRYFISTPVIQ